MRGIIACYWPGESHNDDIGGETTVVTNEIRLFSRMRSRPDVFLQRLYYTSKCACARRLDNDTDTSSRCLSLRAISLW